VARGSSWVFGLGMIGIALLVPAAGGIVEVVLSISAISGGPLLAPPLWALFSKRLNGKTTLWITSIGLCVNLFFKTLAPLLLDFKLSRGMETIVGVGLPLLLLAAYELWARSRNLIANEYTIYTLSRDQRKQDAVEMDAEEALEIKKQNRFGLQVIAGALLFTSIMLFILSFLTTDGTLVTAGVAIVVLISAAIPFSAARKVVISGKEAGEVVA
jgi:SSS family solute:Na+ symporter